MDKNSKCETALTWTPEGRRKVGRIMKTWRSILKILKMKDAADRASWMRFTSALWAIGPEEDR